MLAAAVYMILAMGANEILLIVYGRWMESSFNLDLGSLGLATTVIGAAEIIPDHNPSSRPDRRPVSRRVRTHVPAPAALALVAAAAACAVPGRPAAPPSPVEARDLAPGLAVHVERRFYEVEGRSPGELNRALASRGPRHRGRPAQALTDWAVTWSYTPRTDAGACAPGAAAVEVRLVTTLPRWSGERERTPAAGAAVAVTFLRTRRRARGARARFG